MIAAARFLLGCMHLDVMPLSVDCGALMTFLPATSALHRPVPLKVVVPTMPFSGEMIPKFKEMSLTCSAQKHPTCEVSNKELLLDMCASIL